MRKDYSKHTAEDFIQDDYFIRSVYHPDEESELFWNRLLDKKEICAEEYELAKNFLLAVKAKPSFIPAEESSQLKDRIWNDLQKKSIRRKFSFRHVAAACAVLFIIISIGYYFLQDTPEQPSVLLSLARTLDNIEPSAQIELIISDQDRISIEEDKAVIQYSQQGDIHVNDQKVTITDEDEVVPTVLMVPYGKRSTLSLPDGTQVWVNAGTKIIYPAVFAKDKREIYVDGEVFLDVAHDKNRPFYVRTSQMDIRVLGTSFNVLAYQEDETQSIVLIEGAVTVRSENKKELRLSPNEILTKKDGNMSINHVENAIEYIAWKDGYYYSNKEKLSSLLLRLARYYNINIDIAPEIKDFTCSGKLGLKDISKVMHIICSTTPVNYIITDNGDYYFMLDPKK